MSGIGYLVGAGPGDPGLVTLRARQLIERAEVVIYDYLCNPELLQWAPAEAEIIYAGKSGSRHTLTQDEINRLLVEKVGQGRVVVRLKGGDPFVFGRGGEEARELVAAGLRFEIVPGVTSSIAAPAYAGIPVTHRGIASSFAVFTGHEDPTKGGTAQDWDTLAKFDGTRVVLMGVERLRAITGEFLSRGVDPALPVALVRWGTWTRQETLEGTLGTIADLAEAKDFRPPAVAVFGEVVKLRRELDWFQSRPLFGRRIVVTRTRAGTGALAGQLRELGADVLEIPTIRIEPEPFTPEAEAACRAFAGRYDWLLFASPNAVDRFFDRFLALAGDLRALGPVKIAAVGPTTAARLRAVGLAVDRQPVAFTAEALAATFTPEETAGRRFLLPRGDLGGPELARRLEELGGHVEPWTVYRTVPETADRSGAQRRYREEGVDWITFASASAAENWHRLDLVPEGKRPRVASIGPVTSRALRALGYEVDVEAREHTPAGLVAAILEQEKP